MGRELISGMLMLWLVGVVASMAVGKQPAEPQPTTEIKQETVAANLEYRIMVLQGENTVSMDLEDYLTGVLLAELPGSFHQQAKMAQAVAARTFTVKMGTKILRHGANTVCADSSCCQAYISEEKFLADGGNPKTLLQAKKAVEQTAGQVILYGGELIDATYFSCSGGRTEDAAAVWGADVPYLQAVDSPGEEDAKYYSDTKRFSAKEFAKALGVELSGSPVTWFGKLSRTDGGGVAALVIGGKEYSGVQLRSLLGLRSANFTVTALSDEVIITTRGFGHRVGLSQYGADAMAESGSDYIEILNHYYCGAEVVNMEKLGLEIGGD